ncbi:P-loop NTPase family protein [Brucella grignonensis]|uniref:AAA domain protein n=1 Tax=Brucella grignonensis TaxID=94627 RepID=A0A256FSE2_9HYPH|nr:DNA topology modulation protein FlaR [Brucella grignonensis]OYR17660.1 AAA domain protein [Brucella grignonensis]
MQNTFHRIMIIGGSGSGKTSLAREIAKITKLPSVHIDWFYYDPGWQLRKHDLVQKDVIQAANEPEWIMEGNHTSTMKYRASLADMIIFLDIATPIRLVRTLRRSLQYRGRNRPDMADGCKERFDLRFFRHVLRYRSQGRVRTLAFLQSLPAAKLKYHLKSRREVQAFIQSLTNSHQS